MGEVDAELFLLAEAGPLEHQAVLLCESVRRFAGVYSSARLTVISPRKARRPAASTVRAIAALGAEYVPLDLKSGCPEYGPSFRVLAAAWLERRPGPSTLVQLDTDTLFLREPDFTLDDADFAARPVDVAGLSTTGEGCASDRYWRELCRLCGVGYDGLPFVTTTLDGARIRANYNGGLIAVRRAAGLFQRTEWNFRRMLAEKLMPCSGRRTRVMSGAGPVSLAGSQFWGTSQVVFSLAAASQNARGRILPPAYNVPLHRFAALTPPPTAPIHVHYHWLGDAQWADENPMLDGRMKLPAATARWLRSRMPFALEAVPEEA